MSFRYATVGSIMSFLFCTNLQVAFAQEQEEGSEDLTFLEEIVVTAVQKRGEQRLQDVPISLSVLGGVELDDSQFEGANDAISEVAGVAIYDSFQTGGSKISIRGITSNSSIFSGSSTVAYYLDQIPFGFVKTPLTPDANAYDLESVEVARGPQGTLYGASALAGVVRILPKKANLDEYEAKLRSSVSDTRDGDSSFGGDVALNAPLIPGKLAVRGVLGYQDLGGWVDSAVGEDVNDAEIKNYRIQIAFEPSENFRTDFLAWLSRNERGAPDTSLDGGVTPVVLDQPINTEYDAYSLSFEYDFGGVVLTSSTSYIDYFNVGDLELSPTNILNTRLNNEVFTEEIRLYSEDGEKWNWSIGGFYRDAEDIRRGTTPSFVNGFDSDINFSKSMAIFGEATRAFSGGEYELTVGLRYFEDDVRLQELRRGNSLTAELVDTSSTFDALTPRVVASWYPNSDLTIYGSYSQGYRSGFEQRGTVQSIAPDLPAVTDDLLTSYEVGFKGISLEGRFNYDVAVYFTDWEDTQQALLVNIAAPGDTPLLVSAPVNGEDANGFGVDVGLGFDVTDRLAVSGTFSWNDLTFAEDVISGTTVVFDKGDRPVESPEYTASLNVDYEFPLGGTGYIGRFSGSANYTSELEARSASTGEIDAGDDILTSKVSLSVDFPSSWSATLFVDNASNEDGVVRPFSGSRQWWESRLRPRTVGLRVSYVY